MLYSMTSFFLHAPPLLIYLCVLIVLMLESMGVPIANTTLLLFAGALASLGHVNIWMLAVVALGGSILGACIAYSLGTYSGRNVFSLLATIFHIDAQRTQLIERWFQRAGVWMIFFSRMLPYVRPFACFPAGIWRMPFSRFFASVLSGSFIWCSVILSIGWALGGRWRVALHVIRSYTVPTICLLTLFLAGSLFCVYLVRRHLNSRLSVMIDERQDTEQHDKDLLPI